MSTATPSAARRPVARIAPGTEPDPIREVLIRSQRALSIYATSMGHTEWAVLNNQMSGAIALRDKELAEADLMAPPETRRPVLADNDPCSCAGPLCGCYDPQADPSPPSETGGAA